MRIESLEVFESQGEIMTGMMVEKYGDMFFRSIPKVQIGSPMKRVTDRRNSTSSSGSNGKVSKVSKTSKASKVKSFDQVEVIQFLIRFFRTFFSEI